MFTAILDVTGIGGYKVEKVGKSGHPMAPLLSWVPVERHPKWE